MVETPRLWMCSFEQLGCVPLVLVTGLGTDTGVARSALGSVVRRSDFLISLLFMFCFHCIPRCVRTKFLIVVESAECPRGLGACGRVFYP